MRLIKTVAWAFALTAFIGAGGEMHGLAAYGSPPTPVLQANTVAPQPEPAAITGELVRVSIEQRTFTVKNASGAEMLFRYNDQTIVTGAENSVAGLATLNGNVVTVSYRNDSAGNMASRIEVHSKL